MSSLNRKQQYSKTKAFHLRHSGVIAESAAQAIKEFQAGRCRWYQTLDFPFPSTLAGVRHSLPAFLAFSSAVSKSLKHTEVKTNKLKGCTCVVVGVQLLYMYVRGCWCTIVVHVRAWLLVYNCCTCTCVVVGVQLLYMYVRGCWCTIVVHVRACCWCTIVHVRAWLLVYNCCTF